MKKNIYSISENELKEYLKGISQASYRYKQLFHWMFQNPVDDFNKMKNLPSKLINHLTKDFEIYLPQIDYESKSKDKTIKYAFNLFDNKIIESVLIPSKERVTACISTQVGCKMGCSFCATGKMGFSRNLEKYEIYYQAWKLNELSQKHFGKKLSNIVVMGMGEPLDNFDNTLSALKLIMAKNGMGMSYRRLTLSTVGLTNEIKMLADSGMDINLSVSLHTANDRLRNKLLPVANKHNLKLLAESLQYFYQKTGKRISYEYVLLKGINDSIEDAKELAEFTKITPCKVNLIEYNSFSEADYKPADAKQTEKFMKVIENKNLIVKLRRSRGKDIDAACGQLANKKNI